MADYSVDIEIKPLMAPVVHTDKVCIKSNGLLFHGLLNQMKAVQVVVVPLVAGRQHVLLKDLRVHHQSRHILNAVLVLLVGI